MPSPADQTAALAAASSSGDAPAPSPAPPTTYMEVTRTATYGFLAALPLFVLYEVGILLANRGVGQIRVGADVWLKTLLAALGGTGWAALGGVVLFIGVWIWWRDRDRRPPLVPRFFGLILAESLVYAVVLAFLVSGTVGFLFGAWVTPELMLAQMAEFGLGLQLALSIGAGLYEELVFRVMLVGGLFWVLNRTTRLSQTKGYVIAAVVGAVIFSWVHHTGPFGDPFTLDVFMFRFLFGLALNAVFLIRGFALAAWTHALYDVLVVTNAL